MQIPSKEMQFKFMKEICGESKGRKEYQTYKFRKLDVE